jgi:hypothetical protein
VTWKRERGEYKETHKAIRDGEVAGQPGQVSVSLCKEIASIYALTTMKLFIFLSMGVNEDFSNTRRERNRY